MKKIKETLKKLVAMTLVCAMVCGLYSVKPVETKAATAGTTGSYTLTVTTKANWWIPGGESVTIKQNKLTVEYKTWTGKKKTKSIYGTYYIKAVSTDGKHTVNKTLSGASKKISLKRNKTYKITVRYDSTATWLKYCTLLSAKLKSTPYWYVGSTYKVSNYY